MTLSLQYENEDAPCYSFLPCLHAGSIGSGTKYSYHSYHSYKLQLATGFGSRMYRSIRIFFCKFVSVHGYLNYCKWSWPGVLFFVNAQSSSGMAESFCNGNCPQRYANALASNCGDAGTNLAQLIQQGKFTVCMKLSVISGHRIRLDAKPMCWVYKPPTYLFSWKKISVGGLYT